MPHALTYAPLMRAFLRETYEPLRHGAKRLAAHAETSPRTAENWLRGDCAPSGENLMNLMAANPGLESRIAETVAARRAVLRRDTSDIVQAMEQRDARRRMHEAMDPGCRDHAMPPSSGGHSATGG